MSISKLTTRLSVVLPFILAACDSGPFSDACPSDSIDKDKTCVQCPAGTTPKDNVCVKLAEGAAGGVGGGSSGSAGATGGTGGNTSGGAGGALAGKGGATGGVGGSSAGKGGAGGSGVGGASIGGMSAGKGGAGGSTGGSSAGAGGASAGGSSTGGSSAGTAAAGTSSGGAATGGTSATGGSSAGTSAGGGSDAGGAGGTGTGGDPAGAGGAAGGPTGGAGAGSGGASGAGGNGPAPLLKCSWQEVGHAVLVDTSSAPDGNRQVNALHAARVGPSGMRIFAGLPDPTTVVTPMRIWTVALSQAAPLAATGDLETPLAARTVGTGMTVLTSRVQPGGVELDVLEIDGVDPDGSSAKRTVLTAPTMVGWFEAGMVESDGTGGWWIGAVLRDSTSSRVYSLHWQGSTLTLPTPALTIPSATVDDVPTLVRDGSNLYAILTLSGVPNRIAIPDGGGAPVTTAIGVDMSVLIPSAGPGATFDWLYAAPSGGSVATRFGSLPATDLGTFDATTAGQPLTAGGIDVGLFSGRNTWADDLMVIQSLPSPNTFGLALLDPAKGFIAAQELGAPGSSNSKIGRQAGTRANALVGTLVRLAWIETSSSATGSNHDVLYYDSALCTPLRRGGHSRRVFQTPRIKPAPPVGQQRPTPGA